MDPPTTKIHTLLDIKHLQSAWVAYTAAYVVADCVTAHTYPCVATFSAFRKFYFQPHTAESPCKTCLADMLLLL